MIRHIKELKWSIIFAIFFTLLASQIVAPLILEARQNLLDSQPVVKMQGDLIARTADTVTISISGEKLRPCTFVKLNAFAIVDNYMRDAHLERISKAPTQGNRPLGAFHMGEWMIWPTNGAKQVKVFVQHDCSGKVIVTQIATVDL